MLCFAAKWHGKKTFSVGWPDFRKNKERNVVKALRDLLDEADLAIAHNGKSFDVKWFNTRLLFYKLKLPAPYKITDTRTEAKKYLKTPSNKLNDLSVYYKLGKKLEHEGLELWFKCVAGDTRAWNKMLRYCRRDVELDASFWEIIRPFSEVKQIFMDYGICKHCGSRNLQSRGLSLDNKKRRVQCRDCFGWSMLNNK